MDHLALQVGGVDHVVIDDSDRANACGREIEGGRRSETAGAEQQHLRLEQLDLAFDPDLGQQDVPRVAVTLFGGQGNVRLDRQALGLPFEDAAAHVGEVRVAEPGQSFCRNQGAGAGAALQDDPLVLVGHGRFDPVGDHSGRDQLAALDVRLLVLVGLAGVDQLDAATIELGESLLGRDLFDCLLFGRFRCHRQKPSISI